jgi:tetratricopeptide (TPR) repeat protein
MYAMESRQAGNLGEAYHLFGINLDAARELKDDRLLAWTLIWMGGTARTLHDLEHARPLLEQGLATARAVGIVSATGVALFHLGQVAYLLGDLEKARRIHVEEGEMGRQEFGTDDYTAQANLGFVDLAEGDLATAEDQFKRCLELIGEKNHLDIWDRWWQRRALWGIGLCLTRRGRAYPSAVLLTVALSETDDWPPWISIEHEHPLHVDAWASIEPAISSDEREAAELEAEGLTINEAVEFALRVLAAHR